MINKVTLSTEIREAANLLLNNIIQMSPEELNDNLRYFAEKSKDIAENILDNYTNDVFAYFTEGKHAISDVSILKSFVDFNNGYKQQMLNWMKDHAPEVKSLNFEIVDSHKSEYDPNFLSPTIIIGAGTIIAIGLFIFTNVWIALAAEILAISITLAQKIKINKSNTQLENEKNFYNRKLESKKDELINGLIKELDDWLDKGEKQSNSILESFGLRYHG